MKCLFDFALKFDVLGSNYQLLYKEKSSSKTLLGLFLSFCLFLLVLVSSFFFGKYIFLREDPITSVTQDYMRDNTIFLKDSPVVMLALDKGGNKILGSSIMDSLELSAFFYHFTTEDNQYIVAFDHLIIEQCSESNMTPENYALLAEEQDPSNYLCIDPFHRIVNEQKEKHDVYFRNTVGFYDSAFVNFVVRQCDETLKPGCSQAFKREGHIFFNQMVFESYIDFSDFDRPAKKYIKNVAHEVSTSIFKRVFVKMALNSIFTDEGHIFKAERKNIFHSVEEINSSIRLFNENDSIFADIHNEVSFKKNLYYRRYLKIQEVLANVGGFMKASFFLCSLIVKYYSEYSFFIRFSKEFIGETKIERRFGTNSIDSMSNKGSKIKKKVSFWQYLESLLSKKRALKHSIDLYSCFKYVDLYYITTILRKIEEREQETVITRQRLRQS